MARRRRQPQQNRRKDRRQPPAGAGLYEAAILPGLAPFATRELDRLGARLLGSEEDSLRFSYSGDEERLNRLRRVTALYRVLQFAVPRPKALLGHEHLTRLLENVREVAARFAPQEQRFRFGAAGADSPVFGRLAQEIEKGTGLRHDEEEGELHLRVHPGGPGWEVLVRLSPRPLSAREWRVCNMPGGLNATVAVAALDMLGGQAKERHLNLMCGSGTLLIERALAGPYGELVGVDLNGDALECARANLQQAGLAGAVELLHEDATQLSLPDARFDRLSCDLPWGDAIGDHEMNAALYPRFLAEAARVSTPDARMLVITHELRLFERALAAQAQWRQAQLVRVFHGGHQPGLYLLRRARG